MSAPHVASVPQPAPARAPEAPRAAAARVFCFSVHAEAEPGVMPRVLELFARRSLIPERWISDVSGPDGRDLAIDVQVAGLSPETSDYIARCLRQIHGVRAVLTSEKGLG